jgi:nucleotide-binding universal stress UspA family protein
MIPRILPYCHAVLQRLRSLLEPTTNGNDWLGDCLTRIVMTDAPPIVVASDFGEAARHAVHDAVLLGRAIGAELMLVHVQSITPHTELSARALEAHTRSGIDADVASIRKEGGSLAEPVVAHGSPAETILHIADRAGARWIVLGAGDRSARSMLTGATAETVARFAAQHVWISRPRAAHGLARIGCGVDYSKSAEVALGIAAELCARFGASLHVAHASSASESHTKLREYLDTLDADSRGVAWTRAGRPDEVLRSFVVEEAVDLLVLGRKGASGLRRVFLGGTAEHLLRSVSCSLLLTRPSPDAPEPSR